jgi:PAS domain-containing protein
LAGAFGYERKEVVGRRSTEFLEKDAAGEYVRSLAVLRDVTFLRATELRADHESAVLAQVFESASDAFVLADPMRQITRLNRAAEKLFGCTTKEVAGQLT